MEHHDIAIVGFGPVGQTLAALLGQMGHDIVVVDRWPEPYALPRAVHIDHTVARILQSCGIGDGLESITEPAGRYDWRNGEGVTLLRLGTDGIASSGWPSSSMLHQPTLEALLIDRISRLDNVEVRRGVEVSGFEQHDDHVEVTTSDTDTISARWVIGCDGANSTIRSIIDPEVYDLGYFFDWLIVDVILDEPRVFDPINLQICDPHRPTTAVSGGPGRRRWEFMRLPDEDVDELTDPDRVWELLAPWDVTPDNAVVERSVVYTFAARHVERWRDRRVLLAGDAAHVTPPFAGQGMCAGLRDAANLAWKLDHVLRSLAPDTLLDTYQAERIGDVRAVIDLSVELGRVICVPDPDEAAARDAAMAPLVTDEPTPAGDPLGPDTGIVHPHAPAAGQLSAQGRIGEQRSDEVVGVGWRLFGTDPAQLGTGEAVGWFESLGGVIIDTAGVDEILAGHRWLLQRPDFVVYGAADDTEGARALLEQLRLDLADPATTVGRTISHQSGV